MNQIALRNFGSVDAVRKYAGALRASTRNISTGGDKDILKMDKNTGEWLFGQDKIYVARDDLWAINPLTIQHGYVAFENSEIAETVDGEKADILQPVTQALDAYDELPGLDVRKGRQARGEQKVAWKFQMALEIVCVEGLNKGAQVVFKPSSMGGLRCIRLMAEEIARRFDDAGEDIVPIVELSSAKPYPNSHGTMTINPLMHIVQWSGLDDDTFVASAEPVAKSTPKPLKKEELDEDHDDRLAAEDRRQATRSAREADMAELAEEPKRGRGRPRKDDAPAQVEEPRRRRTAEPAEEVDNTPAPRSRRDRDEDVADASADTRGRRAARDRDEGPANEVAPRGRGRRDDEDERPARGTRDEGVVRGRRAAAGGRQ